MEAARAAKAAPASPCVAECALDLHTGWCRGCARTRAEIAAWRDMGDAEKRGVLERVTERRQGASGGGTASAGRTGAERVPALRWEWRDGCWLGRSGDLAAATVEVSFLPAGPAWWRLLVSDAAPLKHAATPDAAKAAADAAWSAWCERAGLAARVGIVPGYKGAEGQAPDADAHRPERDGPERDDAGAAP